VAPEGIFDAFGWCASDWLEWRSPAAGESTGRAPWDATTRIDGGDPARMVFVLRGDAAPYLPHELAGMHAFGLGLTHERALAPWAIDDATDGLHAHGTRPHEALWLAADNLNALFWGLHDWAHFHNHGPFEPHQRAWTELQCDVTALVWLWINRQQVPLSDAGWERIRHEVADLSRRRFEDEGAPFDASLLEAGRVHELAGDWERTARS
jgi:hypothetical protein